MAVLSQPRSRSARGNLHADLTAMGIVLALGLVVRLFLLFKAGWFADYDESLVGLIAIDITKGARPTFLYGVPYMGTLESYVAAGLFVVFGASREALKAVPLAASLVWIVSTYCLAHRLWDRRAAVAASLVAACPSLYVLANTLKAWGATIEIMALGNLILLFTMNVVNADNARRRALWFVLLGLAIGLGFWLYWLVAYYAVAALGYLLLRRPRLVIPTYWWPALPAFVFASLPLWLYNIEHRWATFVYLLGRGNPPISTASSWDVAVDLFGNLIPRVLGAQATVQSWSGTAGMLITVIATVVAFAAYGLSRFGASRVKGGIIVLLLLAVPALYLASGFGSTALNPWGVDAAGRYVVPVFGGIALALGSGYYYAARSFGVARLMAVVVLFSLCVVNLVSVWGADGVQTFQSPYYNRAPASMESVVVALRQEGIRHVWTDVGLGEPLMFQSKVEVYAADYLDRASGGIMRFPEAYEAVSKASRTAYLVAVRPGQAGPLEQELISHSVAYRKRDLGNLALFIPERLVAPSEVAAGLGYQY